MRVRQQIIIAGAERSGKTYYTENLATKYVSSGQGGVIAYNPGKPEDFSDYTTIEFLTAHETATMEKMDRGARKNYLAYPELKYFRVLDVPNAAGKVFKVSRFVEIFKNRKVKVYKMPRQQERFFWQFIFDHVSDFLLIIDDAKPITRQGVDDKLFQIISRKNHCGIKRQDARKGKGVDVIFIYHNLDTFSEQIFDYTSRMILFKFTRMPSDKIDNPEAFELIKSAYKQLQTEPKYTSFHVFIKDVEQPKMLKVKP